MRRILTIAPGIVLALTLAASCDKSLESTFNKQEGYIESIVSSLTTSQSPDTVSYKDGSVRVTLVQGTGEPLSKKGKVSFWYEAYRITGPKLSVSDLVFTNSKAVADQTGWAVTDSTILAVKALDLSGDDIVEGLRNGLVGVRSGEECVVMFSGRHGLGKRSGPVPSNSALAYHLWIESVVN